MSKPAASTSTATEPEPITRDPRVERTRAHVLAHARDLLTEGGPAAVTYSELAARAHVTRQTLYRHWPNRESLFVDLALDGATRGMPDGSGSPEAIVGEFLTAMRDGMDEPANVAALTVLIAQADHDPTSRAALMKIITDVRLALNEVLRPTGVAFDADEYARLCGPMLFQRFFAREPATDRFVEALVHDWFASRGV